MPFTTSIPFSDEALMTSPPGHMQKVNTPRPVFRLLQVNEYVAAPSVTTSLYLAPYLNRFIISAGCSMRTPTEIGFCSIATPLFCSISKVSRAECPAARKTDDERYSFCPLMTTPDTVPSDISRSVIFELYC